MKIPDGKLTCASQKDGIQDSIGQMKEYVSGSPGLLFVFSDEEMPVPKKAKNYQPQPSQQAKDSAAAWAELFQTEGDYSIFIPGRFFTVYRGDATAVTPDINKYLCSGKSPLVVVTDKAGKIVDVLEGRAAIKRSKIVAEMSDVLRKDGYIQSNSSFARLQQLMNELEKIEVTMLLLKTQVADAAKKFADAQSSKAAKKKGELLSSGKVARENLDRAESQMKAQEKAKYAILTEEYALLKELGLPPAKLGPEPKQPN